MPSARRMYFLNHRHFINKFVTVRANFVSEAGAPSAPPGRGASQVALDMYAQRAHDSGEWSACRELFLDYMAALNTLSDDQDNQVLANEAELRASALYERARTIPRWNNCSLPSRALLWKPAEFMAWEWPGDDVDVLDLSNPSLLYMNAPPGWTSPATPPAPVRRRPAVVAPAPAPAAPADGAAATETDTAATGGAPEPTGGAPAPAGGAPAPTGGAPAPIGGTPAPTGDAPAPTGGAPAPTGGGPVGTGGDPAETGGGGTGDDGTGGGGQRNERRNAWWRGRGHRRR